MNRDVLRFRFTVNGMLASGCMLAIGVVCAPLLRVWHWMVWPTFGLLLLAFVFGWRAYRLWPRWLAEVEAREDQSDHH